MTLLEVPHGLHPRYEHLRITCNGNVLPRGGSTHCYLEDEDNQSVAYGVAVCNYKDQFNKKIGRDISLGRALKELHASLPTRAL